VVLMAVVVQLARFRNLPWVLVLLAALVVGYTLLTTRAVFGRHIYAVGGNLAAATLSGVKVRSVSFWIFVNMGVLAAIAGIIFAGRLNQAGPTAGTSFELDPSRRRSSAAPRCRAGWARSSAPSPAA
jgi:putative multiple sugar transport system permease protein